MAGSKILVVGGTGPAGICLIRELVFRKHYIVVYARNTSKIPEELRSSTFVEVISGEINDSTTLETAMSTCHAVTSLLGPQISNPKIDPRLYPDLYQNYILPGMRKSGVKRIILMGTLSIKQPQDKWTFFQTSVLLFMRLLAPAILRNMHGLADLFEKNCSDLDWTIFRIAQISGDPDEHSWSLDREDMPVFSRWIGEEGWTSTIKRAALTRWLVDSAEDEAKDWIRKMPAVSRKGS